jgi:hypothetical protein
MMEVIHCCESRLHSVTIKNITVCVFATERASNLKWVTAYLDSMFYLTGP